MRIIKTACLLLLLILSGTECLNAQRHIGTNLSPLNDYSSQFVFKDVFKSSRDWIPFNADGSGGWTSGVDVPLRPDGYPVEIPYDDGVNPPQAVRSLVLWDLVNGYPAGAFTLHLEGTGSVSLGFGASGVFASPGTYTFTPDGSRISIEILTSDVSDPIHNMNIVFPGYGADYQTAPFYPGFLDFIEDFEVLRFMDFMETNFSPVVSWSDRTPADFYSQATDYGIAYEYITQLANLSDKDVWVCVPHQADDNYITQLALFLQANLNADLNIYLEYSNEVWNGAFVQNHYAAQQGANLGYTGQPWERTWKYYAKRSADVFDLFEQVFGVNSSRLVKVIGSQSANDYVSDYILQRFNEALYNPNGITANALTIAPYFGGRVADDIGDQGLINTITIDEILDRMEAALPGTEQDILDQIDVADNFSLELITYEGGQHLVSNNYRNNTTLTQKLTDANRHSRMEGIYCDYFDIWYDLLPNSMFVQFTSYSQYSRYGSFGVKEYMAQPLADAPKYRGLVNCVFNTSLPVDLLSFEAEATARKSVLLHWETANEVNLEAYQVERSAGDISFERISKVVAADQFAYQLEDRSPVSGTNYYRLKMIDLDGSFSYSEVKSVYIGDKKESLFDVFPNPFYTELILNVDLKDKNGVVEVLDISGRVLMQFSVVPDKISFENLSDGLYFVRYTSAVLTRTIKVLKGAGE